MVEIKTFEERKEELIKKGEEKGYITTSYIDEKFLALDFIRRDEMTTYVDGLFKAFVDEQLIPIVDDRIDKKIIGATEEQIYLIFEN